MAVDDELAEMAADVVTESVDRSDKDDEIGLGNGIERNLVMIRTTLVEDTRGICDSDAIPIERRARLSSDTATDLKFPARQKMDDGRLAGTILTGYYDINLLIAIGERLRYLVCVALELGIRRVGESSPCLVKKFLSGFGEAFEFSCAHKTLV